MLAHLVLLAAAPLLSSLGMLAHDSRPGKPAPVRPVPFSEVRVTDAFWSARQKAGREGTLEQNFAQCEKTGRFANFDAASGRKKADFQGYFFNDSDVYKLVEGAAYIIQQTHDKALEARIDSLIERIAAAQRPDGYLNTYYSLTGIDKRWTEISQKHEMYCAGHLFEAAVAHYRATGKRTLLDVAVKFADHIESIFGPGVLGKSARRNAVCGHEEIELALVRLSEATGNRRYMDLARYFVEQRGRPEQFGGGDDKRTLYGEDYQDYAPVREHSRIVGHAVRAAYYYSAVTDLAIREGDQGYVDALDRVWTDLTSTKMYITGGIGNSAHNEGFTTSYDLPNDTAYAETCAAIANVMWNHRLAMLHGRDGARYADVMERALYNGVLSGVSLDGSRFFYTNPLASRGTHHRKEWHACACCPPNILRLIASVGGLAYAQADDAVIVNLYMGSEATLKVKGDGGKDVAVTLVQSTPYPWEGSVQLTMTLPEPTRFDLLLRVPGWCQNARLLVNGTDQTESVDHSHPGYAQVSRAWQSGDQVVFTMDMPAQRVRASANVKFDIGRVALQRGPIVYCVEAADNTESSGVRGSVRTIALPAGTEITAEARPELLGGVTVLRAAAVQLDPAPASGSSRPGSLYAPMLSRPAAIVAIPYFAWDNRTPGDMLVWLPESLTLAERPLDPTIRPSASQCFDGDTVTALNDLVEPSGSGDHGVPRMTWWPRRGTTEWAQYDFTAPRTISSTAVYWFDDSKVGGQCRLPSSWKLLYKDGAGDKAIWKEVPGASPCGVAGDTFNRVTFPPIRTTGLRIEAKLREKTAGEKDGFSGGILEWQIE